MKITRKAKPKYKFSIRFKRWICRLIGHGKKYPQGDRYFCTRCHRRVKGKALKNPWGQLTPGEINEAISGKSTNPGLAASYVRVGGNISTGAQNVQGYKENGDTR